MLLESGAEIADEVSEADYAIFNSCTVTAAAEADLRADVRAASRVNPKLRSMVMGCAAGIPDRDERTAPLATLPAVEAVISGSDIHALASALGFDSTLIQSGAVQTGARALLRVQDGCDEHCTFCATTIARGNSRSRSVDSIVAEARGLAATHPEIVITGIHIGTYGRDIGETLSSLVATLIERVPFVRFRLSSVEATEVDDRLANLLVSDSSRLAPHLHAPLQSGSDPLLRRMGRHAGHISTTSRKNHGVFQSDRPGHPRKTVRSARHRFRFWNAPWTSGSRRQMRGGGLKFLRTEYLARNFKMDCMIEETGLPRMDSGNLRVIFFIERSEENLWNNERII